MCSAAVVCNRQLQELRGHAQLTLPILMHTMSVHLVVLPAQDKQQDRRQQDSALKGSTGPPANVFAAPDADISSDETHPQPPLKADLPDGPAFEAPAKSGGSELFDALLMAATGKRIICKCQSKGLSWFGSMQSQSAVSYRDAQKRGGT